MGSLLTLGTFSENCCKDDAERAHIVAVNVALELQARAIAHNRGDPRHAKCHNCPHLQSFAYVLLLLMLARRASASTYRNFSEHDKSCEQQLQTWS